MPSPNPSPHLHRTKLVFFAVIVVILGLASRRYPIFGNYPGDALWATLVATLYAFARPQATLKTIAIATLATAYGVELSQLYQAPWLNQLRSTLPGKLILGSGFDPIDLLAYLVGTLLALPALHSLRSRPPHAT
ncbi:DUF2809 domain-containing protein [Pelagicoccus mobilis]|uniref:DUF2809 domain-containing protein n=1 Tax=Pelagicoccus mobilis TaxID=415221 RepID=A0A934VS41_9BACT|nr:DUF2809 domain-containing protein [Pelagicoccus mobilis]MBK1878273.1 DUF2809 domain-containing protein [Pelagicoccus mobilis]